MSYTERNKGKLVFVSENPFPDWFDEDEDEQHCVIADKLYKVLFEINGEEFYGMANVTVNEDLSIDFDTVHYNGGAHWIEVVEDKLKRINKEKQNV